MDTAAIFFPPVSHGEGIRIYRILLANSEENVIAIEPKLGDSVMMMTMMTMMSNANFELSNNNALFLLLFLLFRDSSIHVQESFRGPKLQPFFLAWKFSRETGENLSRISYTKKCRV